MGRYLVESAGHCVECHSPRTFMGNIPTDMRYAGGPNPEGTGYFPNITPDETALSYWSTASMSNYLHTGISPIGRTAGGDMAEVIENTSQLAWSDIQAMATYVKHLTPIDKPAPGMPKPNWTDKVVMLETAFDSRPLLPTTRPHEINAGVNAYAAGTKSLYLDAALGEAGNEDGKLLSGAAVKVVERKGDVLKLEITGWQPEDAPSNLAIIGRYILTPDIFDLIEQTEPGKGGEIQITDALMKQAQDGCVIAYKFKGQRFDCGSVEGYIDATNFCYENLYKKGE